MFRLRFWSALGIAALAMLAARAAHADHAVALDALTQANGDGSALMVGGTTKDLTLLLGATSDAQTCSMAYQYYFEIEVVPVASNFAGVPTYTSAMIQKPDCNPVVYPSVAIHDLPPGPYKWQARERTTAQPPSSIGPWVLFNGGNLAFVLMSPAGINVTPLSLDFLLQGINSTSPSQSVTITSNGATPLIISAISAVGPFVVDPVMLPITLPVGSSTAVNVSFVPVMLGPAVGTLNITHNAQGSPTKVDLKGSGVDPRMTIMPPMVDFGANQVGTTSMATTVTVGNSGKSPLTISAANVIGPFTATGLMVPTTIMPSGTITFDVAFAPTQINTVSGGIQFISNDGRSPITLPLQGTGTSLGLNAYPNPLDFTNRLIATSSAQTLHLLNNTNQAVTITSATFTGPNASEFTSTNLPAAGAVVAPMSTVDVSVTFQPTDHGARNATLTIASNAPNSPQLVQLLGTGQGPTISVMPPMVDLGISNVGQPVLGLVSIKNSGETTLHVSAPTFGGSNMGDFSSPTSFPLPVAPGATATAVVQFVPAAVGARTASMTFASDDTLTPPIVISLAGTGAVPQMSVSPMMVDFANVAVGTASMPKTITIGNSGAGPLTITKIALGPMMPNTFALASPATPIVVPPGGTRTISPVFAPTKVGVQMVKLTILSDDPMTPSADVVLTGTGVAPMATLAPKSLKFDATLIGQTAPAQMVVLTNNGASPLTIGTLGVSGMGAASYALVSPPTLPATVAPGGTQMLSVTFAPSVVGDNPAMLNIGTDDPTGATTSVTLSGTGASTFISVTPTLLDFGGIHEPGMAMPKTVTISNTGPASITLVDGVLSGPSASSYTVSGVAGMLAVGDSKMATVSFNATVAGTAPATLTFAATDVKIPPVVVSLTGHGVAPRITATPASLDLGSVLVGSSSIARAVVITNVSASPVVVGGVATDGPFSASADMRAMIAPGGLGTFMVGFNPTMEGAATGHVMVTLAGSMQPEITLALSGIGVVPATDDGGDGAMTNGGCNLSSGIGRHGARNGEPYGWLVVLGVLAAVRRRRS